MDYTLSDSYDTHAGTGNRMHEDSKAIPTAMSDKDFNQTIWSLMELVKAPGLTGVPFDPSTPSTYTKVRDAVLMLLQRMSSAVAVAGGTANAITADFTPDIATLTHGMVVRVRAAAANSSTTPTFAPDAIAAKTIAKGANAALANGDIAGAGHWIELQYDQTLDKWVLNNPANGVVAVGGFQASDATLTALAALVTAANKMIYATGVDTFATADLTAFARTLLDDADAATARATLGIVSASTSAGGTVQLATGAEAQALTDAVKAITPATLAAAFQGANNLFSANGYQRLPGGLIIQWGTISTVLSDGYSAFTFPIAFPTACRGVYPTPIFAGAVGGSNVIAVHVGGVSTTGFSMGSGDAGASATGFYWLALGN
jgi:hypothetical protein